jgi:hypothetical protein
MGEGTSEKNLQKASKNVEKLLFDRGQVRDEAKKRLRVRANVFLCQYMRFRAGKG